MRRKNIYVVCLVIAVMFSANAFAGLNNGGFETGDMNGWSGVGEVQVLTSDALPYGWQDDPAPGQFIIEPQTHVVPYEGAFMLKIGSQTADENWAENNRVSQTLNLLGQQPKLQFAFNLWSYDYGAFDRFTVGITVGGDDHVVAEYDASAVDTNEEPPVVDVSGWQLQTIDLAPWLGNPIGTFTIWFEAGDTGDTAMRTRTGVYIDAVSVTALPLPCEGDFDYDLDVDGSDLATFAADFGRTDCGSGPDCEGDFDGDNDVDGSDLATFAADFGRTDCPVIEDMIDLQLQ